MARVVEVLLHLRGTAAYALVFALPALESSAFVGFIFPGEVAVLLGGVLAFQGRVSLPGVALAAILGAIAGDSVGYAVGARYGARLLESRLLAHLVPHGRRERAEELLRRRGWTAVLGGRFTAILRVLIPGLAGMARMRYRRFLLANAVGGVLWAGTFTLAGYLAGDAWRSVERVVARASLLLAILVVMVGGGVLAARWVAANETRLRAALTALADRPAVRRFRARYAGPLAFLSRRLDPRDALGLYLTLGLAASVVAGWAFGAAVQDLLGHEQLLAADAPLARFVAAHRSRGFTHALLQLARLGSPPAVALAVVLSALVLARLARTWRPAAFLAVTVAGGELLYLAVAALVRRPPPAGALLAGPAFAFPSGDTVVAATLFGSLAFALSRRAGASWALRVWLWAAACLAVLFVGLCSVYLAIAQASDVIGGAALGVAWLTVCATGWSTWERVLRPAGPAAAGRSGGPVRT